MNACIILGAGVSGLATAYELQQRGEVYHLLESKSEVGGLAQTYRWQDFRYDSGAHRIHDKAPDITQFLQQLMPGRLAEVNLPSHIFYQNRWIDFPLTPINLLFSLGPIAFIKIISSWARGQFKNSQQREFKSHCLRRYGEYLSRIFLFNYTEKLWGVPAEELDECVSGQRLKGLSLRNTMLELFFGARKKSAHIDGRFLYPHNGIGEVSQSLHNALDGHVYLNTAVDSIVLSGNKIIEVKSGAKIWKNPKHVYSSLPLPRLMSIMIDSNGTFFDSPGSSLRYRHIALVFLALRRDSFCKSATIYFPENKYPFTRIYEPKNRSSELSPLGQTSIVAEIPYFTSDNIATLSDESLQEEVVKHLEFDKLLNRREIIGVDVKRLGPCYPVITKNAIHEMETIRGTLESINNLTLIGRLGEFKYSHIHDHIKCARENVHGRA